MNRVPKWLETLIGFYLLSLIVMEWICLSVLPTRTLWEWLYVAFVAGPAMAIPLCLLFCLVSAVLGPKGR